MIKQFVAVAALVASAGVFAQQQPPQGPQGMRPQGEQMRGPGGPGGPGGPALSRAEFERRASQHFEQLDTNKDGVASPEERRAFHQQHMGEHGHGPQGGAQGARPQMPPR